MCGYLIDQPGDALSRMSQDSRRHTRVFNNFVPAEGSTDSGQIYGVWTNRPASQNNRCIGGIVRDRIKNPASIAGGSVLYFNAGINKLKGGDNPVSRGSHIYDTATGPFQRRVKIKRQLSLESRHNIGCGIQPRA